MKVRDHKNDIYVNPRDYPADRMHYCIVQISMYRYAVAEYAGAAGPDAWALPTFRIVSDPMRHWQAEAYALELTRARTGENPADGG